MLHIQDIHSIIMQHTITTMPILIALVTSITNHNINNTNPILSLMHIREAWVQIQFIILLISMYIKLHTNSMRRLQINTMEQQPPLTLLNATNRFRLFINSSSNSSKAEFNIKKAQASKLSIFVRMFFFSPRKIQEVVMFGFGFVGLQCLIGKQYIPLYMGYE